MPIQVIEKRRYQNLEAMSRAVAEALDSITKIKALKGRQLMQQNIREALLQGPQSEWSGMEQSEVTPADTLEARMARVNEAITATRAKARPKDFFSGLLSAFNPNVPTFLETTPVEELVTRGAVGEMFRDPMDDEYRRAQIDSAKALAQQRRTPRAGAQSKISTDIANWQGIRQNAYVAGNDALVTQADQMIAKLTQQLGLPDQTILQAEQLGTDLDKAVGENLAYQRQKGTALQAAPLTETVTQNIEREPTTQQQFEQTVRDLAKTDRQKAKTYYDKWASKWQ